MPHVPNDSLRIHYEVHGAGEPLLFVHGGSVSFRANYAQFGWTERAARAGFRSIGFDLRGHGESDKPVEASAYGTAKMAGDALAVLDHLGVAKVKLVAYSIGTALALHLLRVAPERFERASLVGTGDGLVGYPPHTFDLMLPALAIVLDHRGPPEALPGPLAIYRRLLDALGGDAKAQRAFSQARYPSLTTAQARAIAIPVQVVCGTEDDVMGRGRRLAAELGRAEYLEVEGADHFGLASDERVMDEVLRFLAAAPRAARMR